MLRTVGCKFSRFRMNLAYCRSFSDECDKGANRKLEPHPDAEKEPLERFPNDINPKTGESQGPRGPEPTRSNVFKLTFWLVPGYCHSPLSWFDKPFAVYTQSFSEGRIDDRIGVRFIQSVRNPIEFVLILAWGIENVTILWGTLPEPMCLECQSAFKKNEKDSTFLCSKHFWFIRFSPDCQFSSRECTSCSDQKSSRLPFYLISSKQETSKGISCKCMSDLSASIHPSICPQTGRLRLSWVSQGNQIRVISCSFGEDFSCIVPMGSYRKNYKTESIPPPLSTNGSLLTSNYCSSCYFWDPEGCSVRYSLENSPIPPSNWVDFDEQKEQNSIRDCDLSSLQIRVVKCSECWPEGHRHPIASLVTFLVVYLIFVVSHHVLNTLSSRLLLQYIMFYCCLAFFLRFQLLANNFLQHECLSQKCSFNPWTMSLLNSRERLQSCKPLNYLAMLQDIRASYLHWSLVPIERESKLRSHSDDPDTHLANQLCGHCHSYFDFSRWRPYDENQDELSRVSIIAHMEEVVFDVPEFKEGVSDRVIFTSPLESDWILVYDMDGSQSTSSRTNGASYQLVTLIDLSTGRQLDPDEPICAGRLRKIQSQCPSSIRFNPSENSTSSTFPMELNNFSVISSCRSLDRLCDPFGGYIL
ncbi:unnamed protein product [Rodentolepis nana]|uniref:Succinate dehydrogenase assembly factor 4, mitochondrial n=1 Tax=Rodentolepis nana TaxID=102285 RepID=A0A158QHB2_RODNA|nr:unnamed protein product [Rodentolepis nana]